MPTPKQVRKHYSAIRFFMYRLQCALNAAHDAEVIKYENYNEGPCHALSEVRDRIEKTTEKARAKAFKDEVMSNLKGVW